MKSYKTTDEQIKFIINGMDKFISYVNNFYDDYFIYYEDMNKTNEQYKNNPEIFFNDIEDKNRFFDGLSNYRLMKIANKVKDDICNIHNTVIGLFINPEGNEYPIKVKEWLYNFRYFCYDNDGNLISLEEQNNRLKNYSHFDASTKKPKTYNTQ